MRIYVLTFSFLGIFILLTSCKKEPTGFNISGNIAGFEDGSKIILSEGITGKVLDSVIIENNQFEFNGSLEDSPIHLDMVFFPKDEEGSFYSTIYMGNEQVKFSGVKNSLSDSSIVSGSKHHGYKVELDNRLKPFNKERNEKLQTMFSLRNQGKWNDSLHQAYWGKDGTIIKIDEQIFEEQKQFISNNINSHYALSQLVILKNDFSKDYVNEQFKKLTPEFKETKYIKVINTALNTAPLRSFLRF